MSSRTSKLTIQHAVLGLGLLFLIAAMLLQRQFPHRDKAKTNAQNFPIHGLISHGHHEFAWTIIAVQSLAATVNAWSVHSNPDNPKDVRQLTLDKFDESLEFIPKLAEQSLGMREIFLFPMSFLAFELNDVDRAIEIARLGAGDPRLEADLATSIAYLSYVFTGDLAQAAKDFERLYSNFPTVTWLERIVTSLKSGLDPFAQPGRDRSRMCSLMSRAFPLAKHRLVQRGICSEQLFDREVQQ